MRRLLTFTFLVTVFSVVNAYSKYGRSCQDIGCLSNEVCVLKEKTCTTYDRGECGLYPACEKVANSAASCATYICPPSQICRIDRGQPRCFENPAATGGRENKRPVENYNPISPNADNIPSAPVYPSNPNVNYPQYPQNPNYPQQPNSGVYPQIPPAGRQTTPRPSVHQPARYPSGGGYTGGQIGSGYPGGQVGSGYPGYPVQNGGYPVQGGGYPVQGGGYPGQPITGQGSYGNTNNRYPTQGVRYPNQGNLYPNQNNYGSGGGYNQVPKNTKSDSTSILDKITNSLKNLGLFWCFVKFLTSTIYGIHS